MSDSNAPPPLLRLCRTPLIRTTPDTSVREAVGMMAAANVGAIAILESDELVGMFTERDLLRRIVDKDLDPGTVLLRDVMTTKLHVIDSTATHAAAALLMLEAHCRHLPVMLPDGRVGGVLSIRHLYRDQLRRLRNELRSLEGYLLADGPGG